MLAMSYRALQNRRSSLDSAFAAMDLQLKRRWELIPNLVQNVQGYAEEDERRKLEGIVLARNAARDARSGSAERFRQEAVISEGLTRLFEVSARYPELESNDDFAQQSRQMTEAENQLKVEQPRYNEAVAQWNQGLESFGGKFFAPKFSFERAQVFGTAE